MIRDWRDNKLFQTIYSSSHCFINFGQGKWLEVKSKPFAPLLGQFLLEKDVENEGVGHQSSEQEEYASCEKWTIETIFPCKSDLASWLTDPTSRKRWLSCPLCSGTRWSHCWRCWSGRGRGLQARPFGPAQPEVGLGGLRSSTSLNLACAGLCRNIEVLVMRRRNQWWSLTNHGRLLNHLRWY